MSISRRTTAPPVTAREEDDEDGVRATWEILSWVMVLCGILFNVILVGIILARKNAYSLINKVLLTLGILDLIYCVFVSPFYVENYVYYHWKQSTGYCKFYTYVFTFHDLIIPLILILLSAYISLKYSGASQALSLKRPMYMGAVIVGVILAVLLALPATLHSSIFIDNPPDGLFKKECRTSDYYTMPLTYFLASSLLFCFTFTFLFSLCIVGSPFLREIYDREEYIRRWRFMLTLSLVNGLYIVTGFLLNFKEISRMFFKCCNVEEPFLSLDSLTYDIWSFTLLISETFFRPLAVLGFYFKYLWNNPESNLP